VRVAHAPPSATRDANNAQIVDVLFESIEISRQQRRIAFPK
jgi:hypothetical protein